MTKEEFISANQFLIEEKKYRKIIGTHGAFIILYKEEYYARIEEIDENYFSWVMIVFNRVQRGSVAMCDVIAI